MVGCDLPYEFLSAQKDRLVFRSAGVVRGTRRGWPGPARYLGQTRRVNVPVTSRSVKITPAYFGHPIRERRTSLCRHHRRRINPPINQDACHQPLSMLANAAWRVSSLQLGPFLPICWWDFAHQILDVIFEEPCPFSNVKLGW